MESRENAVEFIKRQFESHTYSTLYSKFGKHHYGIQELKDLLDFIYQGFPAKAEENITADSFGKSYKEDAEELKQYKREKEIACRKYGLKPL